jgi:hypothetical protein
MSAFGGKADMAYCSANLRLKFLRGLLARADEVIE